MGLEKDYKLLKRLSLIAFALFLANLIVFSVYGIETGDIDDITDLVDLDTVGWLQEDGTINSNSGWMISDYIDIHDYVGQEFTIYTDAHDVLAPVAFYDENYTFITSVDGTHPLRYYSVVVPDGAYYSVFLCEDVSLASFYLQVEWLNVPIEDNQVVLIADEDIDAISWSIVEYVLTIFVVVMVANALIEMIAKIVTFVKTAFDRVDLSWLPRRR